MRLYDSEAAHLSFPAQPIMLLCSEREASDYHGSLTIFDQFSMHYRSV